MYADAATCVVTAAPAPVSELAVSTCVIEYVAPAPVATLLEPPVPSVHVVHVPHVHVVRNTIETPQLQILEKSVGFPATRSDVTFLAPAHVIEHVPVDTYAAPARLAPALVTEYIAQAHVAPSYSQFSTGLVNPQFSPTCVEVSTPKVTSSCQTHQEHLVVGDTTQNGEEFHSVQEQVMVQEIPDTQVIERIQEQTEEQIVDVPAPPIVDDIVEVVQIIPHSLMPQTMEESSEVFRLQKLLLSSVAAMGRMQATASSLDQCIAEHERLTQQILPPEQVADQIQDVPAKKRKKRQTQKVSCGRCTSERFHDQEVQHPYAEVHHPYVYLCGHVATKSCHRQSLTRALAL